MHAKHWTGTFKMGYITAIPFQYHIGGKAMFCKGS